MTLNPSDATRILNYSDTELVQHALSEDLAVLVVANIRLRDSNELLSKVLIRLTRWLVGLTLLAVVFTLAVAIEPAIEAYRHLKWW